MATSAGLMTLGSFLATSAAGLMTLGSFLATSAAGLMTVGSFLATSAGLMTGGSQQLASHQKHIVVQILMYSQAHESIVV